MRACVCARVCGRAGRFPELFVTIEQSPGLVETQCGSFHGVLSNTSNCAVKPLFSALLRKVCQLAESERRRGAREGGRGKERYRERRYHGGVIKEAESGEEMRRRYLCHLGSL